MGGGGVAGGRGRGSAQAAAPATTSCGSDDELSLPHSQRAREQARKQASKDGLGESEWGGVVLVEKWIGQWRFIGQGWISEHGLAHGVSLVVEDTQDQVVVKTIAR